MDDFLPMLVIFSIPFIAIVGGITSGIVKSLGQQRIVELAQRERMMAIERGITPDKLPPLQLPAELAGGGLTFDQEQLRRSHGLMIGGLISAAIGMGMVVLLMLIPEAADKNIWATGLVPIFVGIACLISAMIVRPRT